METDTQVVGGEALTAFENTASKSMLKIIQNLRDRVAEATATDKAVVNSLRASGRGIRIETIPATVAAVIVLQYNQFNRAISIAKVEQMVDDLKAGDWRLHHQGIAFTTEGDLADGQHRLVASGLSGIAITTPVASDFDMAAIDAIDRSTRRTLAQAMQMRGVTDASTKVSVGKPVVLLKHRIDYDVKRPNFSEHRFNTELRKIDSQLSDGINFGRLSVRNVSDPVLDWRDASIAATLLLLSHWSAEQITHFMVSLQQGIAAYDNAPTILLSKHLQAANKKGYDKFDTTTRIALTLKTAVLFAQNKRVSKLSWNEHQEGIPNPASFGHLDV